MSWAGPKASSHASENPAGSWYTQVKLTRFIRRGCHPYGLRLVQLPRVIVYSKSQGGTTKYLLWIILCDLVYLGNLRHTRNALVPVDENDENIHLMIGDWWIINNIPSILLDCNVLFRNCLFRQFHFILCNQSSQRCTITVTATDTNFGSISVHHGPLYPPFTSNITKLVFIGMLTYPLVGWLVLTRSHIGWFWSVNPKHALDELDTSQKTLFKQLVNPLLLLWLRVNINHQ